MTLTQFSLLSLFFILFACSQSPQNSNQNNGLYLKLDLTNLRECSIDTGCPENQSCTSYEDSGKSYCYPSGQESEVAGCYQGELIILNSYPGRVTCFK